MEILRTIAFYADAKGMDFLVIGGHAVNAYGIMRQTSDIDLLVGLDQKSEWENLMEKLEYEVGQSDERFARFRPRSLANWPIDLMFVDSSTLKKMMENARENRFGNAVVKTVAPRHLVALKIHALKYFQAHRFSKDFSDLQALLRSGVTGVSDEDLRELCERYASIELFQKLKDL